MSKQLKKIFRTGLYGALSVSRKFGSVRYAMDQMAFANLIESSRTASGHARWTQLDDVYTSCRRQLRATNGWRFGPDRVHEVIDDALRTIMNHSPIQDLSYCDMGCGRYHPMANSAIVFLNGASQTMALDIQTVEGTRAAEALADLLCDCMADTDRWHVSDISRDEFLSRIRQFDLKSLQNGDLAAGIAGTPLRHVVTDIHAPDVEVGKIDLMSSRAVLEHFQNLPVAAERLLEMMKPGGLAYHHIDIVDHRAYLDPSRYHYWSFLAEPDDWTDGLVNRLRPSEIHACFSNAGFQILDFDIRSGSLPSGFKEHLTPRFRQMSDEDITATGVNIIVQRPEA